VTENWRWSLEEQWEWQDWMAAYDSQEDFQNSVWTAWLGKNKTGRECKRIALQMSPCSGNTLSTAWKHGLAMSYDSVTHIVQFVFDDAKWPELQFCVTTLDAECRFEEQDWNIDAWVWENQVEHKYCIDKLAYESSESDGSTVESSDGTSDEDYA
jgi:hypothetical protein